MSTLDKKIENINITKPNINLIGINSIIEIHGSINIKTENIQNKLIIKNIKVSSNLGIVNSISLIKSLHLKNVELFIKQVQN